jgi:hypothetical protein
MRRLTIAVFICVLVPATAAAASVVNGSFSGKTSQGEHFAFRIVNGRVTGGTLSWTASCRNPQVTMRGTTAFVGHMYRHNYSVHNTYTVRIGYSGNAPGGYFARHVATAHFSVEQHVLYGTFRVRATIYSRSEGTATTCQTPRITYAS